ncbi:MAG: hypothetical protein ACLTGI_08395 [Hoylesella buccalis]
MAIDMYRATMLPRCSSIRLIWICRSAMAMLSVRNHRPFDYFTLDAGVVLGHQQHAVNHVNIIGQLGATPVLGRRGMQSRFGVYQHFNYEHTNGRKGGLPPYQLSEAASIGVGWLCRVPSIHHTLQFEQSFFLNGMLLGGLWSDYTDNPFHKSYNMGSGFTALSRTQFSVGHRFSFSLTPTFSECTVGVATKTCQLTRHTKRSAHKASATNHPYGCCVPCSKSPFGDNGGFICRVLIIIEIPTTPIETMLLPVHTK